MNDTQLLEGLLNETSGYWSRSLESSRFLASLKKAPRLEDNGQSYGLPPGRSIKVFPVDMLPGAPDGWVRGAGAYACPVDVGWGLWFDWTMNDRLNTAILPSVKGMNPITGRKFDGGMSLEQYSNRCPVHKKEFKSGRLCEACGYKWPPQNYVCSPNVLWWDGFRQPDGTVRQFVFTEQMKRDVAQIVIGSAATQRAGMAFGFAFYEPKTRRVPQAPVQSRGTSGCSGASGTSGFSGYSGRPYVASGFSGVSGYSGGYSGQRGVSGASGPMGPVGPRGYSASPRPAPRPYLGKPLEPTQDLFKGRLEPLGAGDSKIKDLMSRHKDEGKKDVAVEAGAKILQKLDPDPLKVTEWEVKPAAIMRLYFMFPRQFAEILEKGGIKDLNAKPEGYLAGIY